MRLAARLDGPLPSPPRVWLVVRLDAPLAPPPRVWLVGRLTCELVFPPLRPRDSLAVGTTAATAAGMAAELSARAAERVIRVLRDVISMKTVN